MTNKPTLRPVDEVPPPKGNRRSDLDWDGYATAAAGAPNQDFLVGEDILESRVKSARGYTRWPFSSSQLRIMLRDSYIGNDGLRRGNVYIRFDEPDEQQEGE